MTPDLLRDIRAIATFAIEQEYKPEYAYENWIWEDGRRVLAWLDAEERLHKPIMPMDDSEVDDEYTWLDFAGSV